MDHLSYIPNIFYISSRFEIYHSRLNFNNLSLKCESPTSLDLICTRNHGFAGSDNGLNIQNFKREDHISIQHIKIIKIQITYLIHPTFLSLLVNVRLHDSLKFQLFFVPQLSHLIQF
jgi:hypothetical protein